METIYSLDSSSNRLNEEVFQLPKDRSGKLEGKDRGPLGRKKAAKEAADSREKHPLPGFIHYTVKHLCCASASATYLSG